MMKNYIFSEKHPFSTFDNVDRLLEKHRKLEPKNNKGAFGNNKHLKNALPRGKAFNKMFDIQWQVYCGK